MTKFNLRNFKTFEYYEATMETAEVLLFHFVTVNSVFKGSLVTDEKQ